LFNPESLYRGNVDSMTVDPKDYYMKLNGLTYTDDEEELCKPEVIYNGNAIPIKDVPGNYFPTVYKSDGEEEPNYYDLIGIDGTGLFKDNEEIIMPVSNSKFKNSNLQDSTFSSKTNGRHDIEIVVGDRILIILEDVMTWWCHLHNASENVQHNIRIGYN